MALILLRTAAAAAATAVACRRPMRQCGCFVGHFVGGLLVGHGVGSPIEDADLVGESCAWHHR